jgi:taurine dioxygenase
MSTDVKEKIRVERQAGALGAHVFDLDLTDSGNSALARDLILKHHVVCFRGQSITPRQHLAFARSLGEIYVHPSVNGLEECPEIVEVFGTLAQLECFHQDSTHSERPPRFSLLVARTLPPYGSDTHFANQHLAFEALSPNMREMLCSLRAVHRTRQKTPEDAEKYKNYKAYGMANETAVHPVVRTHPDTGRKALYVNGMYTKHFEGMTEEESAPLLQYLYRHCVQPHFTFRHRWRPGDALILDNASVQHAVIADMPAGATRYMHRATTMDEDRPF